MDYSIEQLLAAADYRCMHCQERFPPPEQMTAIVTETDYVPLCLPCFEQYQREGYQNIWIRLKRDFRCQISKKYKSAP